MSEKLFVAYIAFWAVVCLAGGVALLKNFFSEDILPFVGGIFLIGMGSIYALMVLLGIRVIRRTKQEQEQQ